jgi:hypothetical protein
MQKGGWKFSGQKIINRLTATIAKLLPENSDLIF